MNVISISVEGNIGSDPELKVFKDDTLATFSLAHTPRTKVNGQWEDGTTMWFKVTFWNTKSDSVLDNLKKGDKIRVDGKLTQSNYTNKAGEAKTSLDITGTDFYMIPRSHKQAGRVDQFLNEVPGSDVPAW